MNRISIAVVALALLIGGAANALEVPPPPDHWFTDRAAIVTPQQAEELDRKLAAFEQQSGAQFIIYVLPSIEGESIEDFTLRCVERWKVGQRKYDNGLVLFVFVKDSKARIEVAYGLEGTITDAFSSRVIRDYLAPPFRQGDYFGGLSAAADALMAKIRKEEPPVPPMQRREPAAGTGAAPEAGNIFFYLILFIIVFFFVLPAISRRGGGCGGCFWPMFLMGGGGGTTFGGRGGFGGGGFGGFSGGGGRFGGGGATGGW